MASQGSKGLRHSEVPGALRATSQVTPSLLGLASWGLSSGSLSHSLGGPGGRQPRGAAAGLLELTLPWRGRHSLFLSEAAGYTERVSDLSLPGLAGFQHLREAGFSSCPYRPGSILGHCPTPRPTSKGKFLRPTRAQPSLPSGVLRCTPAPPTLPCHHYHPPLPPSTKRATSVAVSAGSSWFPPHTLFCRRPCQTSRCLSRTTEWAELHAKDFQGQESSPM